MSNIKKDINIENLDKSMFEMVQTKKISDIKFETKPVSYYQDVWRRFRRNKVAVISSCIILLLILFSIFVPILSPYDFAMAEGDYKYMKPKSEFLAKIGIATGEYKKEMGQDLFDQLAGIGVAIEDYEGNGNVTLSQGLQNSLSPIRGNISYKEVDTGQGIKTMITANVDCYFEVGFVYLNIDKIQWQNIRAYEQEYGVRIIYPMVDKTANIPGTSIEYNTEYKRNANYWYKVDRNNNTLRTPDGELQENYFRYVYDGYDEMMGKNVSAGDVRYYANRGVSGYEVRVLSYEYFKYRHDGRAPQFLFGTNANGQSIAVHIAKALQTSLLLGFAVTAICFVIGAVIGALEGYYGGTFDLLMERVIDIINGIPFMVVAVLFNRHLVATGKASTFAALIFAFMLTGWIGYSSLVRTQFYRYKRQEYVLAARTLGAKDARIMFKHIFPNTLGYITTSMALAIPGIVGAETILTYLNIIRFNETSSIGAMLSDAANVPINVHPHILFWPAFLLTVLMVSFNLLGNGLRDAFNPNLRGK